MARIAVIVDDADFRRGFSAQIVDIGHEVMTFASADAARPALASTPFDLVFVDQHVAGMDGPTALDLLKAWAPSVPTVALNADSTDDNIITVVRRGAFGHLAKLVARCDLEALIDRTLARATPTSQAAVTAVADEILGTSPTARKLQKQAGQAASDDATVLIQGEIGVGKEFVARVVHRCSNRAARPFIVMDCSGLPADLLEIELFGRARDILTGAGTPRRGVFRDAQGGTILLNEIHDLAPATQVKILRVLQTSEVVPLGGGPVKIDVRVIAATHLNLAQLAADGRFRVDLYYRLSALSLVVPPLRERHEDIPELARQLLAQIQPNAPPSLSAAAHEALMAHPWPGNVRQLFNVLRRAAKFAPQRGIEADDLALDLAPLAALPPPRRLADILAEAEIGAIRAALVRANGNRAEAARELGISRVALYDRIKRHGIVTDTKTSRGDASRR